MTNNVSGTFSVGKFALISAVVLALVLGLAYALGFKNPFRSVNYKSSSKDAFVYGYSLVLTEVTKDVLTNVAKPVGQSAPINQFSPPSQLITAKFHDIVSVNVDTVYSFAWVNTSEEPMVVSFPDAGKRFWVGELIDAWTNPYHTLAGVSGDFSGKTFVLVGPSTPKGKINTTLPVIKSPTDLSIVVGRYLSYRTPGDIEKINALQKKLSITPLSKYGQTYTPPLGTVNPNIDMKVAPPEKIENFTAKQFFDVFVPVLGENPPQKVRDAAYVENLRLMGFEPGKKIDWSKFTEEQLADMQAGIDEGKTEMAEMATDLGSQGKIVNGWISSVQMYDYKYNTRNMKRDIIGVKGFGALPTSQAVYFMTTFDSEGNPVNSANDYEVRFKKGEFPPVKGFWSLTIYTAAGWLIDNELNRYNISSEDKLTIDENGDLVIYISANPAKVKSNWLPSGKQVTDLSFALRCYAPEKPLLEEKWHAPAITKVVKA